MPGRPKREDYTTDLTAYNNAGRVLWQKREKLAVIVGVHAVDGVLVVETSNNGAGAILASKTALIHPDLGGVTWVSGSPLFAQPADHAMLFTQASSRVPQVEDGLNFQRVTLRPKLSITPIYFESPTRSNCGEAQGFYDAFGQPTFEGQFISVKRQDTCGEFVARFDWLTAPAAH